MASDADTVLNYEKFDDSFIEDLKDTEYAAMFLDNAIKEYLEDGDLKSFNSILGYIIKAQNVSEISRNSNISRNHLYRIINKKAEPSLTTAIKILKALGYQFRIEPINKSA